VAKWEEYDPDGTHYISTIKLPDFLAELPAPLGLNDLAKGFGDDFQRNERDTVLTE